MAETQQREVNLLGNTVEYEVRHSSNATEPRIDVDIHGVTVILPDSDEIQPTELLKENAAWVINRQRTYEDHRKRIPNRVFEAGEQFPYLGEERTLAIEPRSKHTVTEDSIRLRQSAVEQSSVKRVLKNFYRNRARLYFADSVDDYACRMGVGYEKLEIRNQRTRWGSCSTGGTLSLNWRLIMAPSGVIDYIVVHELAHLSEQNHSEGFWQMVREQVPDYKEKSEWLDENSTKLIFTEDDL